MDRSTTFPIHDKTKPPEYREDPGGPRQRRSWRRQVRSSCIQMESAGYMCPAGLRMGRCPRIMSRWNRLIEIRSTSSRQPGSGRKNRA